MTSLHTASGPRKVLAATDRSATADAAVRWAAALTTANGAELLLLQVVPAGENEAGRIADATTALEALARASAGVSGRASVVADDDVAAAILRVAADARVDTIVVGNVGMGGRKQFLLGNVPNRVSHGARCNVVIVNTSDEPDHADDGRRPVDPVLLRRAWKIGRILLRTGVHRALARPQDDAALRDAARRLRLALDELGPTFTKIGQILSTRPDLLPPCFVEELAALQERVTPLTEAEVVTVMEQELGVPWEDVFAAIDPRPLAAGSIAQVHRATLESGEAVVVKVQRPNAAPDIEQDLALLALLARAATGRAALRQVLDVPAIVDILSDSLRGELDFRREAANLRRMRSVLLPFPRLAVPTVFDAYSTRRLLVMEDVGGLTVAEMPVGPHRTDTGRQLLESFFHQVLEEGFFHADPHPGNVRWWRERVYLLDLGLVGELDPDQRRLVLLLLLAFAQGDAGFLAEIVLALTGARQSRGVDLDQLRADLAVIVDRYRGQTLAGLSLAAIFDDLSRLTLHHQLSLPTTTIMVAKAFAQLQGVAAALDPSLDPFAVAQSYLLRSTMRRLTHGADLRSLAYEAQKLYVRTVRLVEGIESIVGTRSGGGLRIDVRDEKHLEQAIGRAGGQLSLALGLTGALAGAAFTAASPRAPRWAPIFMAGLGATLAARLASTRR